MNCDPLINPGVCLVTQLLGSVPAAAAGGVLGSIANAISDGVRWMVVNTAAWWVQIPSPDLASEPAVAKIQAWLLPVTAAIAVAGVIAAGARMAITRRAGGLLDVGGGLLTIAAAATLGVVVPALLLKAGDAWSAWVLQVSTGGQFTQRLTTALVLGGGVAQMVVVVFGILAIVLSLVQAVLMLFRQTALVILAGVLPLAAAGSVAPMTRAWIRKVSSWMLALIFYKPAAAAVYAAAFTMIGSGRSARIALMGFVMLLLSVVMLPALMKFFTWTTGAIGGPGGGGQLLGAAAVGAVAVGSMRSSGGGGGSAAQDQASYMSSRLGSPPDSGNPAAPGGASGPPAGPSGAGTASPASSGAAAADMTGSTAAGPMGSTAAGSAGSAAGAPTGAASAGSAGAAAGSGGAAAGAAAGAATGAAAAAAGPAGVVAAAAAQAAAAAGHLATGAMEPEDSP
jgi:hypothetical protein